MKKLRVIRHFLVHWKILVIMSTTPTYIIESEICRRGKMIESKFDLVTVKKYKEDLNSLFRMVDELLHGVGIHKIEKEDCEILISSFDNVVRLSGMYNDIIRQVIDNGEITTSDPQEYISSNLNTAVVLAKKVHDKYKHLSRYGK
jgi:hypothetical protein